MSYASILSSVWGKRPIWLYQFTRGGVTTRLTSQSTDYVDGDGVTWTSAVMSHTRFRVTGSQDRATTELVFPQSNAFARGYLTDLSYESNSVVIFHEFKEQSPTARVTKFRGRVVETKALFTRLVLMAENRFTEARRKALHPVMQRPCRHALYHTTADGQGCRLNLADWQAYGTATSISGNVVTVSGAGSQADGYYAGGIIEWDGKFQLITSHTGNSLTLLGPILGFETALGGGSEIVKIAPGCDRTRATCSSRFNNLANHGGYPWMLESPFDGKTLY